MNAFIYNIIQLKEKGKNLLKSHIVWGLLIFLLLDKRVYLFAFSDIFDDGLVALVLMVEHFGVLEMFDQARQSLEPGIGENTDLNRDGITLSLLNLIHFLLWNFL